MNEWIIQYSTTQYKAQMGIGRDMWQFESKDTSGKVAMYSFASIVQIASVWLEASHRCISNSLFLYICCCLWYQISNIQYENGHSCPIPQVVNLVRESCAGELRWACFSEREGTAPLAPDQFCVRWEWLHAVLLPPFPPFSPLLPTSPSASASASTQLLAISLLENAAFQFWGFGCEIIVATVVSVFICEWSYS